MIMLVRKLHLTHKAVLEEKIDRLVTMRSKLTALDDEQNNSSNLGYFRLREEDRQEIPMTDMTEMIKINKE